MPWAIYLLIRRCTKEKSCPIPILVLWELDKSLKLSFTDFMLILKTTIFNTTITGSPHAKLNLVLNSCSLRWNTLALKLQNSLKDVQLVTSIFASLALITNGSHHDCMILSCHTHILEWTYCCLNVKEFLAQNKHNILS